MTDKIFKSFGVVQLLRRRQDIPMTATTFKFTLFKGACKHSHSPHCLNFEPCFPNGIDGMDGMVFSTDGKFVASCNANKVLLFNVNQVLGISKDRIPTSITSKFMNPITSLAISAGNLSIISGDEKGNIFVCDSESGVEVSQLSRKSEFGRVWDIAPRFNSFTFAVAYDDGICRIFDSRQSNAVQNIGSHNQENVSRSIAFQRRECDLHRCMQANPANYNRCRSVMFSPLKSNELAVVKEDHGTDIIDCRFGISSSNQKALFPQDRRACFNESGTSLLCIGSDIVLYDTQYPSNDVVFPLNHELYGPNGVCFAGENDEIIAVANKRDKIYLYSIENALRQDFVDQSLVEINGQSYVDCLRYSRDICMLVSLGSYGKLIQLWSAVQLQENAI